MLATIAIVGRPNVGKSTLFNRLTHSRSAIVSNIPGLTRDRQYGIAQIDDRDAILVDTGGIGKPLTPIEVLMEAQTNLAIEESEIIIFLVDAKSGILPDDKILANKLRKLNKLLFVVVNKIDGQDADTVAGDFHSFGFKRHFTISAEHNIGIIDLKEAIAKELPAVETPPTDPEKKVMKITFVGRPNVGKSTLVNRILGEERLVTHDQPGTTRDSIFVEFNRRNKDYILVDTAGVRRRSKIYEKIEKFSIIKTLQSIEATDVVVFLVDATENITDQDLKLLGFVLEHGRSLVIAVNKWDDLPNTQKDKIKRELERRLNFINFVDIHFISALHGTGLGPLFK